MAGDLPMIQATTEIVAALITHDERIALALGPARSGENSHGYMLAPLALPSTIANPGPARDVALEMGARVLGLNVEPAASPWMYGPSARHAIDREPAPSSDAPFLRYDRFDRLEAGLDERAGAHIPLRRIRVQVYPARARDLVGVAPQVDVIWAPVSALRRALRGLWLADLLALDGVSLTPAARAPTLENTLVYTPAEAGERQVLRACAKYGETILYPPTLQHS